MFKEQKQVKENINNGILTLMEGKAINYILKDFYIEHVYFDSDTSVSDLKNFLNLTIDETYELVRMLIHKKYVWTMGDDLNKNKLLNATLKTARMHDEWNEEFEERHYWGADSV